MKNPKAITPQEINDTIRTDCHWIDMPLDDLEHMLAAIRTELGDEVFKATKLKVDRTGQLYTLYRFKRLETPHEVQNRLRSVELNEAGLGRSKIKTELV